MKISIRIPDISAAVLSEDNDLTGPTQSLEIYLKSGQTITINSEPEKLLETIQTAMAVDPLSLDYSEIITADTCAQFTKAT